MLQLEYSNEKLTNPKGIMWHFKRVRTGGKEQPKAVWYNFKFMATNIESLLLTRIPMYL